MNQKKYSTWFIVPALAVFAVFFLVPMVSSLFFSMTVWSFNSFKFCGFENFKLFFTDDSLSIGIKNTLIYAVLTCGL